MRTIAEPAARTADETLQRLNEGNQRYVANQISAPNRNATRRAEVAKGQHPFATILGCVDSRVPPELIFDCGLGDLFVIRTAGQVVDEVVLGSIEFGVYELGIPYIMVLGHEQCGAVKATIETIEKDAEAGGSIGALIEHIRPFVEKVKDQAGSLLDNAVRANVQMGVARLKESPILAEAIKTGKIKIVGASYNLDTGAVEIIVPSPRR